MYAKNHVGLILPLRYFGNGFKQHFSTVAPFVDRVYVLDDETADQFSELAEGFSDREKFFLIQKRDGVPLEKLIEEGFSRAVEDGMDIAMVINDQSIARPIFFSQLLDPIVWGMADCTKGKQISTPPLGARSAKEEGIPRMNYVQMTRFDDAGVASQEYFHGSAAFSTRTIRIPRFITKVDKKILIALPCFNEGLTIGSLILRCRKYADVVLVIDDGSGDDTAQVARAAGADVIRHPKNRGKAAAIASAIEYARRTEADIMVLMDGDGQHDPTEIGDLLVPLLHEEADLVIGSRFLQTNQIPLYRKLGQYTLNFFTNALADQKTTDSQSGFRALNRKAIEAFDFYSEDFNIESDMITNLSRKGVIIREVPITAIYEVPHKHKKNGFYHGYDIMAKIIGEMGYKRPMLAFGIWGIVMILAGIGLGSWAFTTYYITGRLAFIPTFASGISLILGMLFIVAGLILNTLIQLNRNHQT